MMKIHSSGVWSTAIASALLLLILSPSPTASAGSMPKHAPEWTLQDLDGKVVKSSDYKGKVLIVNFWATWCGPCKAEIPDLIEFQKQYAAQGVVLLGVSIDEAPAKTVKAFVNKAHINYPVVMSSPQMDKAFGGIEAVPTTIVINRQGAVVASHVGMVKKAVLEKDIQQLLK